MSKSASMDDLQSLHALMCRHLTDMLKTGTFYDPVVDADRPLTPAHLAVVIRFLDSNNVKAVAGKNNDFMALLQAAMTNKPIEDKPSPLKDVKQSLASKVQEELETLSLELGE